MLRLSTFAADVRAAVLTGLSTATSTVITAADTVLTALGKLQAQVALARLQTDNAFTNGINVTTAPLNSGNDVTAAFVQSGTVQTADVNTLTTTAATTANTTLFFGSGIGTVQAGYKVVNGTLFGARVVSTAVGQITLDTTVTVANGATIVFEAVSIQEQMRSTSGGANSDLWFIDHRFGSGSSITTSAKKIHYTTSQVGRSWIEFSHNAGNGSLAFGTGWNTTALLITPTSVAVSIAMTVQEPTAAANPTTKTYVDAVAGNNIGRNMVMNARFEVLQRGVVTINQTSVSGYIADRWRADVTGGEVGSVTVTTATDADRTAIGNQAVLSYVTMAATGSTNAGAYTQVYQGIETVRYLAGKSFVLSFWAKGSTAINLGLRLYQFFGTGGSPSANVTVSGMPITQALTTTWTRYSFALTFPSVTGKVFGTNGDNYTLLALAATSGSTNAAAFGVGAQTGNISVWGVQIEFATALGPLEFTPYDIELNRCKRFYQTIDAHFIGNAGSAGEYGSVSLHFPIQMRSAPSSTMTPFSTYSNIASGPIIDQTTPRGARMYAQASTATLFAYDTLVAFNAELV